MSSDVTVVVATRDRRDSLVESLERLVALPERSPVIVVDNASTDGTAGAVRRSFPRVELVTLERNRGGAARSAGAERAATPYIAFSDDDSWWAPGALSAAADLFARHSRLGLIAARVLVGPEERVDETCVVMSSSPLGTEPDLPGPSVLGFVACGAIVRRDAYLQAGGFRSRLGVGGEEEVLAIDLATAGWALAYVPDIVAHHHPSEQRDRAGRQRVVTRNALWSAWLRRRARGALRQTWRVGRGAFGDSAARAGVAEALAGVPWVLRERRPVSPALEARLSALDA
jgi:GT2 family glycosyltransferase